MVKYNKMLLDISIVLDSSMEEEWVTEIRDKCVDAGVAFFFKQWGGRNKKAAGCLLDGRMWNEYPA